ncbi:MAG TPA: GldG family protein [Anaerolineales bacterium]|nr:GldG family protein [Anaerolineales bacterium]
MNKRYAPIGLILAGLSALTAFSLYFVQREWNLPLQISLALVVVGLAAFVILDPDRARNMMSGRQARYGSNAIVLALAFTGIIIVINVLIYQNATDWKLRWDWTENKENTLAPETIEILTTLPEKVTVRAYYTAQSAASLDPARGLLDDFAFYGGDNFEYEVIDPGENPIAATEDGVDRDATLILQMGDNKETVTLVNEKELATALVRLRNPGEQKVYFLIGHGEFTFEETGDTSLTQLKTSLEDRNYTVESLNLLATNAVPEDAKVVVIPGPQVPLTSAEVELLRGYLDAGGTLIALTEPPAVTQFGNDPDPLADYLKDAWGIVLQNDIIIDLTSQQPVVAISAMYNDHVITQKLQSTATVFPTARSVSAGTGIDGVSATEIILTSQQSWAETDINSINAGQVAPNEGEDLIGPVPLAVVANNAATGGQVVVVGDADFVTNQGLTALGNIGNTELILNAVNWGADQEDLISLTPKDVTTRTLQLPPQAYVLNLILFAVVLVLPGLMLISGVVVWFQRRRRA